MNQPIYETGHQMGPYPNIIICLLLGAFPLAGICLIVLAIYTSVVEIRYDGYSMIFALLFFAFVIGAAFFFLILGWAFISGGLARYRFDQAGLIVLGGDVLNKVGDYTYDNWYYIVDPNISLKDNVIRSIQKCADYSVDYIKRNDFNVYFH